MPSSNSAVSAPGSSQPSWQWDNEVRRWYYWDRTTRQRVWWRQTPRSVRDTPLSLAETPVSLPGNSPPSGGYYHSPPSSGQQQQVGRSLGGLPPVAPQQGSSMDALARAMGAMNFQPPTGENPAAKSSTTGTRLPGSARPANQGRGTAGPSMTGTARPRNVRPAIQDTRTPGPSNTAPLNSGNPRPANPGGVQTRLANVEQQRLLHEGSIARCVAPE